MNKNKTKNKNKSKDKNTKKIPIGKLLIVIISNGNTDIRIGIITFMVTIITIIVANTSNNKVDRLMAPITLRLGGFEVSIPWLVGYLMGL